MKPLLAQPFREAVRSSPELERVGALSRRPPLDLASPRAAALVELMTERLRRPDRPSGAPCGCRELGRRVCIDRLLAVQAWALWEAPLAGGLLAPIGVGAGKTLLDILMPMVMPDCRVAALLLPPGLVGQLTTEYEAVREHFRVPSLVLADADGWISPGAPALHVVPYSRFSRAEATDLLERLQPDLVECDEAHNVKNREAARTARVLRYFAARPDTRMAAWSGSLTSKSLLDFAHLSAFALGDGSPLPLDPEEAERWAAAIDPSDWPAPAGALRALCAPGESLREATGRRIRETRGVVSTTTNNTCPASIVLRERKIKMPASLSKLIRDVRASWTRPDGEEFVEALEIANCVSQLISGFYYRWRFPDNPPLALVEQWFAARKAWHKELRVVLADRRPHMDSPLLCLKAALRAYEMPAYAGDLPVWRSSTWPAWRDIRSAVKHETETIWVDDYLVKDAAAWASSTRGIVWYEHTALGQAIAEMSGLPLHAGGPDAEARILAERGDRSIIASIASHGTGRNGLQWYFDQQYVANPPSGGDAWEQLLGRLHRVGQKADEVVTYVLRHAPEYCEAIDRALGLAKYVEGIFSNRQKLLAADCEWALKGGATASM